VAADEQAAIDHYHKEIDGLLAAGIVPMATLLHFTHPLWLEDRGGFENDEAPAAFLAFARRVYQEFGGKVRWRASRQAERRAVARQDWCCIFCVLVREKRFNARERALGDTRYAQKGTSAKVYRGLG